MEKWDLHLIVMAETILTFKVFSFWSNKFLSGGLANGLSQSLSGQRVFGRQDAVIEGLPACRHLASLGLWDCGSLGPECKDLSQSSLRSSWPFLQWLSFVKSLCEPFLNAKTPLKCQCLRRETEKWCRDQRNETKKDTVKCKQNESRSGYQGKQLSKSSMSSAVLSLRPECTEGSRELTALTGRNAFTCQ